MYSVIERHRGLIIDSIAADYVDEYEWLIEHRHSALDLEYQRRYKLFWVMGPARLSDAYYQTYFNSMLNQTVGNVPLNQLPQAIYTNALRVDGKLTCQFSFASKLLHMHDSRRPIYDSRVARFFFADLPTAGNHATRSVAFEDFYSFLDEEYARVINSNLLANSIAQFKDTFQPQFHTDEKIIDWLLWAFDRTAGKALQNGEVVYH